jgi:hypothetical protein
MVQTWQTFLSSFLPRSGLLAVFMLVISALYMSGKLQVPDDCSTPSMANQGISSCVVFVNDPTTATDSLTLAWTSIVIVMCFTALFLLTPGALEFVKSGSLGKLVGLLSVLSLVGGPVALIVIGAVIAKQYIDRKNDEDGNRVLMKTGSSLTDSDLMDDGGAALLIGIGVVGSVVLCFLIAGSFGELYFCLRVVEIIAIICAELVL